MADFAPPVVACLNGSVVGRVRSPSVPVSTAELAAEAKRCADAGATYVVIVPRDDDGSPSRNLDRIREAVLAVQSASGIAVAVSLLDYDADASARRAMLTGRAELVEIPVGAPRMVRFDAAVSAFGPDRVLALPRSEVSGLALDAQERGMWPIALATDLLDIAAIDALTAIELLSPALPFAVDLDEDAMDGLLALRHRLSGRRFALGVRGQHAWRAMAMAAALGGGLRVGFDYGASLPDGTAATSNAALVEGAVNLLRSMGRAPESAATFSERLRTLS